MNTRLALALGTCLQALLLAATAAEPRTMPQERDFGVASRHVAVPARVTATHTLWHSSFSRHEVEGVCEVGRKAGIIRSTPQFGPGFDDEFEQFDSWSIVNPNMRATYTAHESYTCPTVPKDVCSCSYARFVHHVIHIVRGEGTSTRTIDVDVEEGTRRETVVPQAYVGPSGRGTRELENPASPLFAGPVVGRDVVGGVPCTRRHIDGDGTAVDTCVVHEDANTPFMLWGAAADAARYKVTPAGRVVMIHTWLLWADPATSVDAGLFDAPPGLRLVTGAATRSKP